MPLQLSGHCRVGKGGLRYYGAVVDLTELSEELGKLLLAKGMTLAVAESCTGGWLAKVLTDIPGSSGWFDCGFVTYSNTTKTTLLGVGAKLIADEGAVSEPVVRAMADGVLANSDADLAVAISGIAGPGGALPGKPVGTVCFGFAVRGREAFAQQQQFDGDRGAVRAQPVAHALQQLIDRLSDG